jgi:predicted alpha-1,2-mannosidase
MRCNSQRNLFLFNSVFILYIASSFLIAQQKQNLLDYVNVFTGTSNSRWMLFPGPTLPFGMVKLSPDNQNNIWNGGYEYTVSSISGFSHLHAMSLSGVSLMPVTGKLDLYPDFVKVFPGEPDGPFGGMWTAGYRSRFKKETERAGPGYYSVYLLDYNIKVELTATLRCGIMRLTYPESGQSHILMNNSFPTEEHSKIFETYSRKIDSTEIEGYVKQSNNYAGSFTVYYVIQVSKPFDSMDAWKTDFSKNIENIYGIDWQRPRKLLQGINEIKDSSGSGIILNFKTFADEQVIVRTGISFVSTDNARLNLESETKPFGWDFDAVVNNAKTVWNNLLGRIEVTDDNENNKEKFYTCLYRSFTGKSVFNDVNGQYPDMCGRIQQLPNDVDAVYSADGFWGGQWDLAPLWTLVTPGYASSWTKSWLELADKGGWIPEAPTGLKYAPIMGAQHHNSLIISSYQKGIRDFDAGKAFNAIKHDLTTQGINYPCGGYAGNRQMQVYMDYGFVPDEDGPVSNTLEYAYDDWCAGQFALALNKSDDFNYFNQRSQNYRNVYDSVSGWFRRKHKDGKWVEPLDLLAFGTQGGWNGPGYMEGNAWIYSVFVPHDVPGLISLTGNEKFNNRLEEGFQKKYFDLGNEPSLETPFLFNYSGEPWLTQKYSRYVLDNFYDTSPYTGWIGEEDEGQLSAYFVLLAMGLFEMDGGCSVNPAYNLSSPLFSKIVIHLDKKYYNGNTFTIKTVNNSGKNIYIQSALLNGKPFNSTLLSHADLINGGELIFEIGPRPNKNFGLILNK